MRVVVIDSGVDFSTSDVVTGIVSGLRANGCEVLVYPLSHALDVYLTLQKLAQDHAPPTAALFEPYSAASHAVVGYCLYHEPDAVIAVTGDRLHFASVLTLRKAGFLTALLCTESPYMTEAREQHDAAVYDVVFTNEQTAVPLFRRNPPARVHYLPHAYNAAVHTPGPPSPLHDADVFFVGSAFPERRSLFDGVDWTGIDLQLFGTLWDGDSDTATILARQLDNSEAVQWYRTARINLNHHRTTADYHAQTQIAQAYSLGPRAYEIAACGGFQLMDDSRAEAREVFGDARATYRAGDSADLERQIRFWLDRPDLRAIVAAAQHEAIQPHSWQARAADVLTVLSTARAGAMRQAA